MEDWEDSVTLISAYNSRKINIFQFLLILEHFLYSFKLNQVDLWITLEHWDANWISLVALDFTNVIIVEDVVLSVEKDIFVPRRQDVVK